MRSKVHFAPVMLCLIMFSICYQVNAWEDINGDGQIVRLTPPPGREWVMKPDSTWTEVLTGYPLADLMDNPDDWPITRSRIDYFCYYGQVLHYGFGDEELWNYFNQLNSWGINLDLQTMALKDQQYCTTGEGCYSIEKVKWYRFFQLGADIASLTIDEPYTAAERGNLGHMYKPPLSNLDYAVRESADWLQLVQEDQVVGGAEICLIESYPEWFNKDELIEFIDELKAECLSRDIDFIDAFCIDHNWNYGSAYYWNGLIDLEEYCEEINLPFSYIIWPAQSPWETNNDLDFYDDIMEHGDTYFNTYGGSPAIVDFMDWVWVPRQMVPEYWGVVKPNSEYPFTWAFNEFYDTYLADRRNGADTSNELAVSLISSISPNPSCGKATVSYTCSGQPSNVRFQAFDITGRLVSEEHLVNATQGDNSFYWDRLNDSGEMVSAGIYFVQIIVDGNPSVSSKLVVVD